MACVRAPSKDPQRSPCPKLQGSRRVPRSKGCGKAILVIVGDRDEVASAEELGKILHGIDRSEMIVLGGNDHFFMAGLADLGREIRSWL